MTGSWRFAAIILTALAGAASAEVNRPKRELRDTLGVSVNLPGLQNSLELSWRWDKAGLGIAHVLAPSYTRLNLWAEVVPVPLFAVRAGIEPGGYFGIGTALLAFDGYGADFSTDARGARDDKQAGFGGRVSRPRATGCGP